MAFVFVSICRMPSHIGQQKTPSARIFPRDLQDSLLRFTGRSPYSQDFDRLFMRFRDWRRLEFSFWLVWTPVRPRGW